MLSLPKTQPTLKIVHSALVDLPVSANISIWWNFSPLLGLCLIIQIITGLFSAMHYTASVDLAFSSVAHICRDVNYGWLLRTIHANGASFSLFSLFLYFQIGRGMYYGSFHYFETWMTGIAMLFLVMAATFLGYVLPWGQMSFWGATMIANLVPAVPYVGNDVVQWLWGGFGVDNPTLTRFFIFHFLIPFLVAGLTMIHLLFLHQSGSNNPLGINANLDKLPIHPYFTIKDTVGFMVLVFLLVTLSLTSPYLLGDLDNFIPANPLVTPAHIQPEWYFLFAYAIIRSIPNKLGGVVALISSILILISLSFTFKPKFCGLEFYSVAQPLFWSWVSIFVLLTWIGERPVEDLYIILGQILTCLDFSYFSFTPFVVNVNDKII